MDNSLSVTGVLVGKDVKAQCTVRVHVKTGPFFVNSPFTDCAIEQAPCDFPDGAYEVRFLNQAAAVRHEDGQWSEGILWDTAT